MFFIWIENFMDGGVEGLCFVAFAHAKWKLWFKMFFKPTMYSIGIDKLLCISSLKTVNDTFFHTFLNKG